ncbi:MAG: MarR family transcriptional regulator [Pseudomonadota bacterium]
MRKNSFLPILRELARCYQAFESLSARHIRTLGLTPPQFDLIVTLGNTAGMSFKELGEKTLITKGTLTGVVDRLVAKKLVRRSDSPSDGRSRIVQLTAKGEALFARVFPAHLEHLRPAFAGFDGNQLEQAEALLRRLRRAFAQESA